MHIYFVIAVYSIGCNTFRWKSATLKDNFPILIGYGDSLEDKSKANVVQIKGRFSVTSENVDLVKVNSQSWKLFLQIESSLMRKNALPGYSIIFCFSKVRSGMLFLLKYRLLYIN